METNRGKLRIKLFSNSVVKSVNTSHPLNTEAVNKQGFQTHERYQQTLQCRQRSRFCSGPCIDSEHSHRPYEVGSTFILQVRKLKHS